MNIRIVHGLLVAPLLVAMLGCSSQRVEPELAAATPAANALPAPQIFALPPEGQRKEMITGHFCRLGTSCMALDSRPFEPCLLSTTHCKDKSTESLLVDGPNEPAPPSTTRTTVRPEGD